MATTDLDQLFAPSLRQALLQAIRDRPELTIGQLAGYDDKRLGPLVASIKIAELISGEASKAHSTNSTGRGRVAKDDNYRAGVIKTLADASEPLRSEQIREKVGGNAAKLRSVMEKLMAEGKVRRRGTRRGTNYALK